MRIHFNDQHHLAGEIELNLYRWLRMNKNRKRININLYEYNAADSLHM